MIDFLCDLWEDTPPFGRIVIFGMLPATLLTEAAIVVCAMLA